jgi:hypothetical protein
MNRITALVALVLIMLSLVPPTMAQQTQDTVNVHETWTRTHIIEEGNGLICHTGNAIAGDGNGTFGVIARPCAPALTPSSRTTYWNIAVTDATTKNVTTTLVKDADIADFPTFGATDLATRHVMLRWNGEQRVFYGCVGQRGGMTWFPYWDPQGTWFPGFDPGNLIIGTDDTASRGGQCGAAHVPGRPNHYVALTRDRATEWISTMTINNYADFDNKTHSVIVHMGGPGSAVDISAPHTSPLVRAERQRDGTYNFHAAYLSPPALDSRIIHGFCTNFDGSHATTPIGGWMPCVHNEVPAPESDMLGYRALNGLLGGADFAQGGIDGTSHSWSVTTWQEWHRTGNTETICEPRKGRLGLPPLFGPKEICTNLPVQELVNVICMDARLWTAPGRATGFCHNEHDEWAIAAGIGGARADLGGTGTPWFWRNPCISVHNDVIIVAFEARNKVAGETYLLSTASSNGGRDWKGLRPFVQPGDHEGTPTLSPNGNCVTYDITTDTAAILYQVHEGADGGHWLATNSLRYLLTDLPSLDWGIFGQELGRGDSVHVFGVPLEPARASAGTSMLFIQLLFATAFSASIAVGSYVMLGQKRIIAAGGIIIGIIFAHVIGLLALWAMFFLSITSIATYANADEATLRGLEWRVSADLLGGPDQGSRLNAFAGATHLFEAEEVIDGSPRPVRSVANRTINAGVQFDRGERFSSRLTGRYVGNRTDDDWNSWPAAIVQYPAFVTLDWTGEIGIADRYRLGLLISNLTDENYYEVRGYPLPGRAAQVRLSVEF